MKDLERMNLLCHIDFSKEEVSEVEGFVAKLKQKYLWEEIQQLAEEVMSVHPCGETLRMNLEKVEKLESEAGIHKYSLDLLLIIECALIFKRDFEEKVTQDDRLSMDIFYDSMKDITYKMHECQKVYGVTGIFVGFWYDGFFDMTRFALGRLQFEMMPLWLSEPVCVAGTRLENGMEAINVHIPSSGPLTSADSKQALAMAAEFFKDRFVGSPVVFVMASWLLDEDLMTLLPEGNIKEFVKHFQVINTNKSDSFDDGWRVFGNDWAKGISYLPRNTRLQKAIADYLQQGGKLGYGYGVMVV